jgi:hypothetical protein
VKQQPKGFEQKETKVTKATEDLLTLKNGHENVVKKTKLFRTAVRITWISFIRVIRVIRG